jgi:hypothetical protein
MPHGGNTGAFKWLAVGMGSLAFAVILLVVGLFWFGFSGTGFPQSKTDSVSVLMSADATSQQVAAVRDELANSDGVSRCTYASQVPVSFRCSLGTPTAGASFVRQLQQTAGVSEAMM